MPLLCIPGDQAVDVLTRMLHARLEDQFGNASRAELEAELDRQFEENGVDEDDARVVWLRAKMSKIDENTP